MHYLHSFLPIQQNLVPELIKVRRAEKYVKIRVSRLPILKLILFIHLIKVSFHEAKGRIIISGILKGLTGKKNTKDMTLVQFTEETFMCIPLFRFLMRSCLDNGRLKSFYAHLWVLQAQDDHFPVGKKVLFSISQSSASYSASHATCIAKLSIYWLNFKF